MGTKKYTNFLVYVGKRIFWKILVLQDSIENGKRSAGSCKNYEPAKIFLKNFKKDVPISTSADIYRIETCLERKMGGVVFRENSAHSTHACACIMPLRTLRRLTQDLKEKRKIK